MEIPEKLSHCLPFHPWKFHLWKTFVKDMPTNDEQQSSIPGKKNTWGSVCF